METLGWFFWKVYPSGSIRYTREGSNINISIQICCFERASLAKTISDPGGQKNISLFLWVWSLLASTSTVKEGFRIEIFGWFFWKVYPWGSIRYTLEGSNINISIQICCFERASLAKTISDPGGQKNISLFLWVWSLLASTSTVNEGLDLCFERIPLRGLISTLPSKYVVLNVHPWQKPFQTLEAKKLSYCFFEFGLCCPQPVLLRKALEWKFLGDFFERYTFEGSNINISINFWRKTAPWIDANLRGFWWLSCYLAGISRTNRNNMMSGDWRVTIPKINGTKSDGSRMVRSNDFRPPF